MKMIKTILFALLIGSMLLACDGDIDEISMNLELSTAVTGVMAKNVKFTSGDADTIYILSNLHAAIGGNANLDKTVHNGLELTCTNGSDKVVILSGR